MNLYVNKKILVQILLASMDFYTLHTLFYEPDIIKRNIAGLVADTIEHNIAGLVADTIEHDIRPL